MKNAVTMFYGTITTEQSNRSILESMDAEVGDYDERKGYFYVRASKQVLREIEQFGDDFKGCFVPHADDDDETVRSVELMTTVELKAERARLEWLVHSEPSKLENADSSRWVELWLDLLARVTDRLSDRSPVPSARKRNHVVGFEM